MPVDNVELDKVIIMLLLLQLATDHRCTVNMYIVHLTADAITARVAERGQGVHPDAV